MMIMNKEESFGSGSDLASPLDPAKPHKGIVYVFLHLFESTENTQMFDFRNTVKLILA